jgi:hypothetical protein
MCDDKRDFNKTGKIKTFCVAYPQLQGFVIISPDQNINYPFALDNHRSI